MTKQDSQSSIKQENAALGPNDLSDLVRIADEALKQEGATGLIAAFEAMFGDDDEGDKNENNVSSADEDQANATDDKDNKNANEDMRSFLSMVGSLKE